ncbi:MAG: bifunctional serine/threonine-protein kinase/formylglycine-generating enzyme family protein, partial [Ardenticatenaceae bacterium]
MIPSEIGRYEVIEVLGSGAMGTVYRAQDPNFAREVAIKVLPGEFLDQPEFWAHFRREVQVIASLDHPAIMSIYDFGEDQQQPFIVMKFMNGGSLADRLRAGPLSIDEAAGLVAWLAPALDEAHARGIIHGTLKPSNILFDQRNTPYLTDFGMAQFIPIGSPFTLSNGFTDTSAYISPEQARANSELDGRSDIYALGAILFEMLTGERPYQADSPLEMALCHLNHPIPELDQARTDLPAGTQAIIERAMAKDRNSRYSSAAELSDALNALTTASPYNRSTARPAPKVRGGRDDNIGVQKKILIRSNDFSRSGPAETTVTTSQKEARPAPPPNAEADARKRRGGIKQLLSKKWLWGGVGLLAVVIASLGWFFFASGREVSEKDGMVQLFVPAGEFLMGSPEDNQWAYNDESPQRTVYLDPFWIDQTEVSNAMFTRFVEQSGHQTDAEKQGWGFSYDPAEDNWVQTEGANWKHPLGPQSNLDGLETHPVVQVTWHDAKAYCEWAGRRLPTEAEWEKAARGTDGRKHPWGDENVADQFVNLADINFPADWSNESVDDGYQFTSPVGSYPDGASPYGALDMVGNVWEWAADWYDEEYYQQNPPNRNPTGADETTSRSLRGGSFSNGARWVRSSYRGGRDPATADMG